MLNMAFDSICLRILSAWVLAVGLLLVGELTLLSIMEGGRLDNVTSKRTKQLTLLYPTQRGTNGKASQL